MGNEPSSEDQIMIDKICKVVFNGSTGIEVQLLNVENKSINNIPFTDICSHIIGFLKHSVISKEKNNAIIFFRKKNQVLTEIQNSLSAPNGKYMLLEAVGNTILLANQRNLSFHIND